MFQRSEPCEGHDCPFEGLCFRHMDLFRVKCVWVLLQACRETLETLKLYPSDPHGEGFLKKEKRTNSSEPPTANSLALLRDFNSSPNKSLRTLETTVEGIGTADNTAFYFFKTVPSSVTPSLLDVAVVYRDIDTSDMLHCLWCYLEPVRLWGETQGTELQISNTNPGYSVRPTACGTFAWCFV